MPFALTPPDGAQPSRRAAAVIAMLDAYIDESTETVEEADAKVLDCMLVWQAARAGWERALAAAQGAGHRSFRELAALADVSLGKVQDGVASGRAQRAAGRPEGPVR